MVDSAFAWLHAQTGNTTMLRLKSGGNLTLLRYGKYIEYNTEDGTNDPAEALANASGADIAATNHGNGVLTVRRSSNRPTPHDATLQYNPALRQNSPGLTRLPGLFTQLQAKRPPRAVPFRYS